MKTLNHVIIIFLLSITAVSKLQADDFELIKRMPYGPSQEVIAQNDLVCLGSGTVLQICRLQADSLILLSEMVLSDYINGLDIEGNYLYVANDEQGLLIINIAQVTSPEIIGSYGSISSAENVHARGDTLYLQSSQIVEIIDVQVKTNPSFIERFGIGSLRNFSIHKNLIYAGCGSTGLKIYDISDLSVPQELANIDTLGYVKGVFYNDNHVYTVSSQKGLVITDVNDPSNPQVVSCLDTPGYPDDVYIHDNYAYISDFYSIRIIDITNKNDPEEIKYLSEYPYTNSVFAEFNRLYSTSENAGVRVYDITSPQSAEKIYTNHLPDAARRIIYNNKTLYRNDSYGDKVTVSKFSFPDTTGVNSTYVNGYNFFIRDSNLFVGDGEFIVYDISNPENPVEISRFDQKTVRFFTLEGDTAYCTTGNSNLLILDISDIHNMKEIGYLEVSDHLGILAFYNSNLYVQRSSNGFIVYDVSDFSNIQEKMRLDLNGIRSLQIKDSLLFIAAAWEGLFVYDISDPDILTLAGHYSGTVISFFIEQHLIYAACSISGLRVLDWSNLEDITEFSAYDTYGECYDVFVSGDTVIVADGENGVLFLKNNIEVGIADEIISLKPQSFLLHQNYPNPFNPITNISYQLPVSSKVELTIHNIRGQKVATLVSKLQSAGSYKYEWDASGQASGVYFSRFTAGDFVKIKKLILLQ